MAIDYTRIFQNPWGKVPQNAVKAFVTLTVDTQVTNTDTMTIGSKVYTFVTDGTESADGDISIGTDLATGQANIVAAINGTDSINTAHTEVSAGTFAANDLVITALLVGTDGNSIASTETFTAVTNVFDSATLAGGQYATPVSTPALFISGNDVYLADQGVSKWDLTGWKKGTVSVL